jgi:hypothetical protein
MEHGVYICSWSRSAVGYTVWLKSRPNVRVSASTFAEAEELLIEAIHDDGGAMQAVMEFDPPLPKSALEEKYCGLGFHLIGGDDRFEAEVPRPNWPERTQVIEERLRWLDTFYEKPVCRRCKYTSGRRNGKLVTLTYAPRKYDGAFGSFGTDGGPNHQIVSEAFLALLTTEEKCHLEFQPTIGNGDRKFFELVGPEGPPHVAVAGMKISGWRCTQCDHRTWGYWIDGMAIGTFVARQDLPAQECGVFTVGLFPEIELAVTALRWKELVGKKGARGFTSRQLGVVPDHEVVRHPKLPTHEERLAENRQRDG